MGGVWGTAPAGCGAEPREENLAQNARFQANFGWGKGPTSPEWPQAKDRSTERRCGALPHSAACGPLQWPAAVVLVVVLLPLLRPRACQPCCMRAFSTHDAPAAARTSVPAAVDDSRRASPAPGRSSLQRGQRVSAALRRAAAPYADGCEQIFGSSQPISLLILRVYLDVRMVHCIES